MYVVLEEIDDSTACLVPDSQKDPIYLPVTKLPQPYKIGDVYLIEERQDFDLYLKKDDREKERRLRVNKLKRQRLLKKSDRKKSEQ